MVDGVRKRYFFFMSLKPLFVKFLHCAFVEMELSEKVIIITGASSGIGAVCATTFAKHAFKLVLVGRNEQNLIEVAERVKGVNGFEPLIVVADISVDQDVEKIIRNTITRFERIDVLVNNAGIFLENALEDDMTIYDRVMATNQRGSYNLTSKAVTHLVATQGNIVNISSVVGSLPKANLVPYCMSKAAINMMTITSALELAPKGVRVNAVCPGPVNTELFIRAGLSREANEQMIENFKQASPLKRIPSSEDIAEMVLFLASSKANCITGCLHTVDAGIRLGMSQT